MKDKEDTKGNSKEEIARPSKAYSYSNSYSNSYSIRIRFFIQTLHFISRQSKFI